MEVRREHSIYSNVGDEMYFSYDNVSDGAVATVTHRAFYAPDEDHDWFAIITCDFSDT